MIPFYSNAKAERFGQAVYQIPTETDHPTESVALALQRVFYHLQTSEQPVGKTRISRPLPSSISDSPLPFRNYRADEIVWLEVAGFFLAT